MEHQPEHQEVVGLIPGQGTYLARLWVQSPAGERTRGNGSMFLSHIDVSLSRSLTLSKINKHILK